MRAFREAVEAGDADAMETLLAEAMGAQFDRIEKEARLRSA